MNSDETRIWLAHHRKYFSRFADWLDERGREDPVALSEMINAWQRVLSNVQLWAAKAATEQLFESETQPKSFELHVAAVKRIANEKKTLKDRSTFGQGSFKCQFCRDSGSVCVFVGSCELYPQYMRVYGERAYAMTASIPCSCEEGAARLPHAKLRHDPDRSVVCKGPFACLEDELKEKISSGDLAERTPEWSTSPDQGGF